MLESLEKNSNDLLVAIDRTPESIERRKETVRRTGKERRKANQLSVGLEISHAGVSLAIVREDRGQKTLVTDYAPFDNDHVFEKGNWSSQELATILIKLVEKHRLSGQGVVIGLGGKPCVTRALIGDNEEVDANVAELQERSNRYLALGMGDKVSCYAENPINAKRKRAWVTIAHRGFVELIADAVSKAGLRLVKMEHTLTVLCQLVGQQKLDVQRPVLIVSTGYRGSYMALSYQGRLLLDYRPPACYEAEACNINSWAEAVKTHIKCIRRFLQNQLNGEQVTLNQIIVPGRRSIPDRTTSELRDRYDLETSGLPITELTKEFRCDSSLLESPEMLAAIWLASDRSSSEAQNTVNLVDTLHEKQSLSFGSLVQLLWPIAAALLLLASGFGWNWYDLKRFEQVERQIAELEPSRLEASRLRLELTKATEANREVEKIRKLVRKTSWPHFIYQAGKLLPEGAWLESIQIDRTSRAIVVGASFTDDGIYDYVGRLNQSPKFDHVTLRSTESIRANGGPAYRFEIVADILAEPKPISVEAVAEINDRANSSDNPDPSLRRDQNG